MASNRFPIIIPCHRVVAAGGIGKYGAPGGSTTKQRMLDLETFNELLDIVRDLLGDQEKLLDRTKAERKRQALEDLK